MRSYKLLRFGKCYINREGNIKIMLIGGSRRTGYVGIFDCQHPAVMFHKIYLGSRIVPNDGSWMEVDKSNVSEASRLTDNYGIQMGRVISPLINPPHFDFGSGIFSLASS